MPNCWVLVQRSFLSSLTWLSGVSLLPFGGCVISPKAHLLLPQVISTQCQNTNVLIKHLMTTPLAHPQKSMCLWRMMVTSLVSLMLSSQRGILFHIVSLTLMAFLLIWASMMHSSLSHGFLPNLSGKRRSSFMFWKSLNCLQSENMRGNFHQSLIVISLPNRFFV